MLLWVLPILALISLIAFNWLPQVLQNQLETYEETSRTGWVTWLQEFQTGSDETGGREGDFAADEQGRIWVAGGPPLRGLHYYDGEEWIDHDGDFQDLAFDPNGDVWAVHTLGDSESGVDIFYGQQWKNVDSVDFGLADIPELQEVMQVEFGSDGRIWAVTNQYPNQLVEIIQQDQGYVVSDPIITVTDGDIKSLDTDNNGNVWVAVWVWGREGDEPEWPSGLYTYDGESIKRVPDKSVDLSRIIRTRFDDQGNAWVITEGGAVMTYDGEEWSTVVDENRSPANTNLRSDKGLFVDNRNRLWLWQYDSVHFLENGTWTSFTEEDSGFAERDYYGSGVFGVIVDDRDRLWIASSGGVSMIPVKDAKPLPDESVNRNRNIESFLYATKGVNWFLPSTLILLWLAVFLNVWPGVLLAFGLGVFATLGCGPPQIVFTGYNYSTLNPGVLTTFSGMVGGLVGGQIDKTHVTEGNAALRWNYILAVIGLIVGFGLGLLWYIGSTP